jgi:hypothetical protein
MIKLIKINIDIKYNILNFINNINYFITLYNNYTNYSNKGIILTKE